MKTIMFFCTDCEKKREINVSSITPHYIVGNCSVCKLKVTINQSKLDSSKKLTLHVNDFRSNPNSYVKMR